MCIGNVQILKFKCINWIFIIQILKSASQLGPIMSIYVIECDSATARIEANKYVDA
jgi:hypothetical protein